MSTKKRRFGPPGDFIGTEPSLVLESIERRTQVRGPVRDLVATLPGGDEATLLEAGRRDMFVALDDPDRFALGAKLELTITDGRKKTRCKVEVVRKEIAPRRGVAVLIVHMSPAATADYLAMLVP